MVVYLCHKSAESSGSVGVMPIHSMYSCEDRPDCPDLVDHWQKQRSTHLSASQVLTEGAYFLAFVIGDADVS